MRCSALLLLLSLAGCSRQQDAGALRRVAILPFENLSPDLAGGVDAGAVRLALWESLQAQPAIYAALTNHRRDLPELHAAYVVDGYVTPGVFHLRLNDQQLNCAGTLETCAPRLVSDLAGRIGVTARPVPNVETLRTLSGARTPAEVESALVTATKTDATFAAVWLARAAEASTRGGVPAALEILRLAPLGQMTPYDAAMLTLRMAELQQDRPGHRTAIIALARLAPADVDLQLRAAREAALGRDFATAAEIYDRLLLVAKQPAVLNQAAYVAALMGDRQKAEQMATAAEAGAPNEPQFADTHGDIAYFFGDYAAAARLFEKAAGMNPSFLNGLPIWKAAMASQLAGETSRAEGSFRQFADLRTKAGAPNTLLLEAVWDWQGGRKEAAYEKLQRAISSSERGKALFLYSLMALNQRDFGTAEKTRRDIDPNAIESVFLRCLMDGVAPPPNLPVPPEGIQALHQFLRGDAKGATASLRAAQLKMDPFTEGQWRKLDLLLAGKKEPGVFPPSPDDWLAVLLR